MAFWQDVKKSADDMEAHFVGVERILALLIGAGLGFAFVALFPEVAGLLVLLAFVGLIVAGVAFLVGAAATTIGILGLNLVNSILHKPLISLSDGFEIVLGAATGCGIGGGFAVGGGVPAVVFFVMGWAAAKMATVASTGLRYFVAALGVGIERTFDKPSDVSPKPSMQARPVGNNEFVLGDVVDGRFTPTFLATMHKLVPAPASNLAPPFQQARLDYDGQSYQLSAEPVVAASKVPAVQSALTLGVTDYSPVPSLPLPYPPGYVAATAQHSIWLQPPLPTYGQTEDGASLQAQSSVAYVPPPGLAPQ